jgi:hypothetical protein
MRLHAMIFTAAAVATACAATAACSAGDDPAEVPPAAEAPDAAGPDESQADGGALPPDANADAAPTHDAGPPLDVPASLVKALGGKTYVEESCTPATYPGWPYPAQKCTYQNGLVVTIANPTPERVARWIVEASKLIPALDALEARDHASWEAGLAVIAAHTIGQSSRIFPLEGQVYEDGTAYKFERGVTKTCSSGCYCRVNSTSRQDWCAYAADVLGTETESACLAKFGQTTNTLTDAWLAHCFDNHVAAWNADRNEHYRAQAWRANQTIATKCPNPASAPVATVIAALKAEYP